VTYDHTKSIWANLGDSAYDSALKDGNSSGNDPLGYARNLSKENAQAMMRDPRFIQDLIDFYRQRDGKHFADVESAVEHFFSDRAWRNMNSVSLGRDLYDAYNMPDDQGQRLGRLQAVYDAFPNFYEEGGRGAKGLFQNLGAIVADPVNLIGFGSGGVAARGAAAATQQSIREAAKQGVAYSGPTARAAGMRAGIKTGALTEAPVSGAIEAGFDLGIQNRNVQLGIQDEVNLGQTALSAGAGAAIGGAAGGLFGAGGAAIRNPLRGAGARTNIERGIDDGNTAFDTREAEMARVAQEEAASRSGNAPDPSDPASFEDSSLTSAFDNFQTHLQRELDNAIDEGLPPNATSQDVASASQRAAAGQGTGIAPADQIASTLGVFRSLRTAPVRVQAMRAEAQGLAATDPATASKILAQADTLEGAYRRLTRHVVSGAYDAAAREAENASAVIRMIDGPPAEQPRAPAGNLPPPDPNAPLARGPGGEGDFIMPRGPERAAGEAVDGAPPSQASDEIATEGQTTSAADGDAAPTNNTATDAEVQPGTLAGLQQQLTDLDNNYKATRTRTDNLTRKEKAGTISEPEAAELANLRQQRDAINEQKTQTRRAIRAEEQRLSNEATETAAGGDGRPRIDAEGETTTEAQRGADELMADADDVLDGGDQGFMRSAEDVATDFSRSEKDAVDFLTETLGYDSKQVRRELRAETQGKSRIEQQAARAAFVAKKINEVRAAFQLNKLFEMVGGLSDYRAYIPDVIRALARVEYPDDAKLMSEVYDRWFQQQAPAILESMYRRLGENAPLPEVMREIEATMGSEVSGVIDSFFRGNVPDVQRIGFDDVSLGNMSDMPEEAQKAFEAVRKRMIEEGKARGWKAEFVQLALNTYVNSLRANTKVAEFKGKKRLVDNQNMNPLEAGAHIGRKQDGLTYNKNGEIVPRNAVGGLQSILRPANHGPEDRPFFQRLFQVARGRDEQGNAIRFSADEAASRAIEDAYVAEGTQRRRRDSILSEQNANRVEAIDEARKLLRRPLKKEERELYEAIDDNPEAAGLTEEQIAFYQQVKTTEKGKLVLEASPEEASAIYQRLVTSKAIGGGLDVNSENFSVSRVIELLNDERGRLTSDVDVAVRGREVETKRTDARRVAERIYARYTELVKRRDATPEGSAERAAMTAQLKGLKAKVSEADPTFFEEKRLKRAQRKALAEAKLAANNSENPPTDAEIAKAVGDAMGVPTTRQDMEVATEVADRVARKVAINEKRIAEQEAAITAFREHQDAARLTKELEDISAKYKALEAQTTPATKPVGRNEPMVVVHKGVEVDVKNTFRLRENADGSFEVRFLGEPVGSMRKIEGGFEINPADPNLPVYEFASANHALRNLPMVFEARVMLAHKQSKLATADAPKNLSFKENDWRETNTYKGTKEEPSDAPSADDIEGGRKDARLDARVAAIDVPPGRDVAIQILSGPLEGTVRVIPASREGFDKVSVRSVLGRQESQQFVVGHVESGTTSLRAQETFRPSKEGDTFIKVEGGRAAPRAKTHVYSGDPDVVNPETQPVPFEELLSRTIDPEDMPAELRGSLKTFQDLHDAIVGMESVAWNHPSFATPGAYGDFIQTLTTLYGIQAKVAPHGIKYPNASRRGSMNQLSSILGSANKQEVSAIFNVLRGLSGTGGAMPRFTSQNGGGYFYTQPHSQFDPGERNAINIDLSAQTLQQPTFAKTIHEVGHWAYFNVMSPEERVQFWSAMGKYVTDEGLDANALKTRLPGSANNELHSPAEFFANQWTQWVLSTGRAGDPAGLVGLWRKAVRAITSVIEKFFMGGQRTDLIDPDLIPLFERILPDAENNGMKYQAIAKKFAGTGGRVGIIAKKLDDYELLKAKIENAVRSGSPDEMLAVLAGDGSGSTNYVSEIYAVSGKRGSKFLRKKPDGTGGGRRIGLFDGGETIGQRVNKKGEMIDAVGDPNGYHVRGKMLRLMFDIQRSTAEMRRRQIDVESDAAQRELDALIASQADGDELGLPDLPTGARGMEELALQNFTGDVGDLELLGNAAIEVLNEAQTALRQQFRRAFPKTDIGEGLAILPDGTLQATTDSAASNVFRKRAQTRKKAIEKNAEAEVNKLLKAADEAFNEAALTSTAGGESVVGRSPRDMNMSELAAAMRAMGRKDERFAAHAAEMMRKINSSPEIGRAADETPAADLMQFADRDNKSLLNGLLSAFEKADANRVSMIAAELRARQNRLGDKSDPFLLPKDSKVGRALQIEAQQLGGVPQGNGIPPDAPIAIKEALTKFSHRDKRIEYTLRTLAYRMMNLMGRTEKDLLNDASFMTVEDVYRMAGMSAPIEARGAFADMSRLDGEPFNQLRKNLRRYAIGLHSKTAKATPFDLMHEVGHMVVRSTFTREQLDTIARQYSEALVKGERIAQTIGAKYGDADVQRAAEEWFVEGWANYLGERVAKGDIWAVRNGEAPLRFKSQLDALLDRLIEFVAYVTNGMIGNNSVRQQFRRLTFYGDMFAMNRTQRPYKAAVDATNNQAVIASLAPHYARDVVDGMSNAHRTLAREFTGANPHDDLMDFVYYSGVDNAAAFERGALNPSVEPSGPDALFGPGVYLMKPEAMGRYYSEEGHISSIRKMIDEATDNPNRRQEGYEIARLIIEKRNEIDELTRDLTMSAHTDKTQSRANKFMDADGVDDVLPDDTGFSALQRQRRLQNLLSDEKALFTALNRVTGTSYNPKVVPLLVRAREPFDFRSTAFYNFTGETGNVSWLMHWLSKNGYLAPEAAENLLARGQREMTGNEFYELLTEDAMLKGGLSLNPVDAKVRLQSAMRELGYDSFQVTEPGRSATDTHDGLVVFESAQVRSVDADVLDPDRAAIHNSVLGDEVMGVSHRLMQEMAENGRLLDPQDFIGIGQELQRLGMPDAMQRVVKKMTRKEELAPEDIDTTRRYGVGNALRENSSTLRHMGANWFADRIKGESGPSIFDRHNADLADRLNPLLTELRKLPDAKNMVGRWLRKSAFAGSLVGGAKAGALAGSAVAPGVGTAIGTVAGMAAGAMGARMINIPQPKSHERIMRAMREGRAAMARLKPEERAVAEKIQGMFREELAEMRRLGLPVGDVTSRGATDTYVPQMWDAESIRENPTSFLKSLQGHFIRDSRMAGEPMTSRQAGELSRRIFDKIMDTDGHLASDTVMHQSFSNPFFQRFINLRPGDIAEFDRFMVGDLEGLLSRYYNKTVRKRTLAKEFGVGGHAYNAYRAVAEMGREAAVRVLMTDKNVFVNRREFFNSAEVENLVVPSLRMSREEVEGLVEKATSMLGDNAATAQANKQRAKDVLMSAVGLKTVDDAQLHNYRLRVDAIVNGLADFKKPARAQELRFMDNMVNVLNQRPIDGSDGTGLIYAASRNLRAFNSVTLLGFTTLTSIPDVALPLIRSGNMGAWLKGMQQWYRMEPSYRQAVRDVGVGIENLMHDRMVHMGGDGSQRFANSFFNLTMLTPWTNMQREVAGLVGFNAMKAEAEIARKYAAQGRFDNNRYKTAVRFLERYGLTGPGVIEGGIDFATPYAPRLDDIQTYAKHPQIRYAVMRFTNESIFTPDPNDVPMWAQTPWGALIFQLKSFPVMMGRMAKYTLNEAKEGNIKPLSYMLTAGVAFGMGAIAVKDVAQSRGGEENRERALRVRRVDDTAIGEGLKALGLRKGEDFGNEQQMLAWYFEGMMAMGGLGFLGELFFDSAANIDNGNHGFNRMLGAIVGPSYDAAYTGFKVAGAAQEALFNDGENTSKIRSGARAAASRVPVLGGDRDFRETMADLAGPAGRRGNGGNNPGSFGRSGAFKSSGFGNSGF
jgi:hypothetical protein